ncbi:MAG TPA: sigma-70 family RNA polymerase sigma factor [Rhodanobacteraceae bacterium]|nr:sigma-70 family RNA polymerase sigma factor [Rhodanobacteraceae bacterium]
MDTSQAAIAPPYRMNTRARFEAEVMRHLGAAYNLARWLARNDQDAEDVTQEAALRAFRYFEGFRGGDARVWLLTIVRNTFYSMRAGASQDRLLDDFDEVLQGRADEDTPDPEVLLLRAADAQQVRAALQALPAEYREILVLREFEECSYKEIAAITQLKIGTVMSRLARARQRLAVAVAGAETSS